MKSSIYLALLVASCSAGAAGYPPLSLSDSGDTCYTWEGGRGSAGSFTKCSPTASVASAPLPPPVVASPVMMPLSAPVTCVPPPKPIVKHKARPAPKKC